MFRGFLSGLLFGAVICAFGLASLSLLSPPGPRGEAPGSVDVAVPAGSEFNRNRPEAPPIIPGSEDTGGNDNAPLVTGAEGEAAPATDTASAGVPNTDGEAPTEPQAPSTDTAGDLRAPAADQVEDNVAGNAAQLASGGAADESVPDAPDQPIELTETDPGPEPAQPAATEDTASSPTVQLGAEGNGGSNALVLEVSPEGADGDTGTQGQSEGGGGLMFDLGGDDNAALDSEPERSTAPAPTPTVTAQVETPQPQAAETSAVSTPEATQTETAMVSPEPSVPGDAPEAPASNDTSSPSLTIQLPTIGGDQDEGVAADSDADNGLQIVLNDGSDEIALGALARNAVPFTDPGDKPLMSIILIDVGAEGLDRDQLTTFSFPVTIAIDPVVGDVQTAAKTFRNAGLEVIVQSPPLPSGIGRNQIGGHIVDVLGFVPQSIGLVDAVQGGFQSNSRLSEGAIEALMEGGHGLVIYDRPGLKSALRTAEKNGLPAAEIYRTLDAEREDAETINLYLDTASQKAAQMGHVIMIGHSYPETVKALFTWAADARSQGVTLAPLSAILRQQ